MSAISDEFRKRLGKTPKAVEQALDDALVSDGSCTDGAPPPSTITPFGAEGVVPPDAPPPVTELPPETKKTRKSKVTAEANKALDTTFAALQEAAKGEGHVDIPHPLKPEGYTLCINTMPLKHNDQVILLSEVLAPIVSALSDHLGVPHYRLAKEAEYGRGDALLLTAYKQTAPYLSGYVYVDKRDSDAAAVLSHIESNAQQIFRAVY